jgi:replicative DNA helicase
LRLSDKDRVLGFLDQQSSCFPTGIPEFDKRGFGPTRKEMHLYIAAAKRGKSWWLTQLAKMAVIHRLRVCHITLEMSEERCAQRYLQAFFAMAKRPEKHKVTKFQLDSLGRITGFDEAEIKPKLSIDDPNIVAKLEKRLDKFHRVLDDIYIKQFPTGNLTVRQLRGYLDSLESNERFMPDLLIVDYPDLMKLDKDNYRLAIDEVYKQLRGIAVERNLALAIVSQGNRSSEKAKNVGSGHVAEAWSKIAHADCIVTYNQTSAEHQMGLARLYVSGGRNDEDKLQVVISQNYSTGAFVVDSALMAGSNYWEQLPKGDRDEDAP